MLSIGNLIGSRKKGLYRHFSCWWKSSLKGARWLRLGQAGITGDNDGA